jgi:glycosidase
MHRVIRPLAIVLPFLAALRPVLAQAPPAAVSAPAAARHTFTYVADRALKSVTVAGTFNNWDKAAAPLKADPDGRTWRVSLPLPYGRHQYKFVLDGETWVTDPKAPNEDDGGGNRNSVLVLLPPDYARPARPDDGVTARSALLHETRVPYRNYDRGALTLSLRARPGDLRAVRVVVNGKPVAMRQTAADAMYARYAARVPWDRKRDLSYTFELTDGARVSRYGANGLSPAAKPFVLRARGFQPFAVPSWVERSVLYQIFPDRFGNGDKRNDPPDVQPWDAKPTYFNRYGGDVAGVRKHLGYLQGLGVSAVYFNPVFASPSNHRYDAADFKRIDPQFGTNAEFASLTQEMQRRGIRTVMDFVFNHTATTFPAFADVREKGAASPYKDWYFVRSFPVRVEDNPNYVAWFGFPSMPKLNVLNPATHDYLLGLADYWRAQGVPLSGLRLDVAGEVEPRFWRDLRKHVKPRNPETWIVGEVWGDGSPWLGGDQWDSVMNYRFRDACLRFFPEAKTTPTQFLGALMAVHEGYAPQVSRNMMNLLSSHDTPRFLTLCKNDAALHKLAAAVQFTWVGAPSVYYGEEIGMEGGADPDNRRGMRWDLATAQNPMLAYYRKLVRIRNNSRALQSGDPVPLVTDDKAGTLAYARVLSPGDYALVALNRSDAPRTVRVPLPAGGRAPASFTDALTGRRVAVASRSVTVTLPAKGAGILLL